EADDRDRAVEFIADVRVAAVTLDRDRIWKLADREQLRWMQRTLEIDDRELVRWFNATSSVAPSRARQRPHPYDRAGRDIDDVYAVLSVSRIDRPIETAVMGQRATRRKVPDLGHAARRLQMTSVRGQQQRSTNLAAAIDSASS